MHEVIVKVLTKEEMVQVTGGGGKGHVAQVIIGVIVGLILKAIDKIDQSGSNNKKDEDRNRQNNEKNSNDE